MRVHDGSDVLEGGTLDELAQLLRQKYPDVTHERRLHWERDEEAEERKARALDDLAKLLAEAAVREMLREAEEGPIAGTVET